MQTADLSKAGRYELGNGKGVKTQMLYNNVEIGSRLTTTLVLLDPCEAPTTITASSIPAATQDAATGATDVTYTFDAFAHTKADNSITACTFTYSSSVTPFLSSGVWAFNPTARTFSCSTEDASKAGRYTFTVTATTPAGEEIVVPGTTTGTKSFDWALTIRDPNADPCEPPTSVTPTSLTHTTSYMLGSAAHTITWDAFTVVPATCALTYVATIPGTGPVAAFTTTNVAANRQLVLSTSTTSFIGSHDIFISAISPGGLAL